MADLESGFLTDKEIIETNESLFKHGFIEKQATGASYDMSLGEEVYISGKDYPEKLSDTNQFVVIPRGQFALLMTEEYVTMPNDHLGLISMKFSIKAKGLINVSGFHVDPGFKGKLVFSVFNAGPTDVILKYGDPTFMVFFYKLKHTVLKSYNSSSPQEHLPVSLVTSLKGTSASLSDVDGRVARLEIRERIYWAILIALITALIALFLKKF